MAYRDIRERDLAERHGLFIVEGETVLRMLLASRNEVVSLLLSESKRAALSELVAQLSADVPVYSASQSVMNAIAGLPIHRGVLALGRRPAPARLETQLDALPPRALAVVLSGISNHDNMGGLFRNAAAFGADLVVLDRGCCDPHYRKAIRVSVGAALTVPFVRVDDIHDALDALAVRGFAPLAFTPRGERSLAELTRPPRASLLFGGEGEGLADDVLARTQRVRIPMAGDFDSLNVATTSGIVLHYFTCLASDAVPSP